MARAELLACDWGTTNLRAWTLDAQGAVTREIDLPLGVSRLAPGEAGRRFHEDVRPRLAAEGLPAIICGMVGSNIGWLLTPYVDCPAGLEDLGRNLVEAEPSVRLVPGLRCAGLVGAADVMRGEETQVFGWLAQGSERRRGRKLIYHPGTHGKWVIVEDGRIIRFITAMTGELFAVLKEHSILKSAASAEDAGAFEEGLEAAGDGTALAARLFSARGRVVGGDAPADSTPAYLSGLLIGAEVASMTAMLDRPQDIVLLGDDRLCGLYRRAFDRAGIASEVFDGETAAVAGLHALHQMGTPS